MKEDEIIQLFANQSNPMVDDCHLFDGNKLVTTDSLSEGTHFRLDWSTPEDIAIKLIEVNVSDIFSSGGVPKFCLLNLGLSKESRQQSWIQAFAKAFHERLTLYGIELVGGDTFSSNIAQLSLTLFGELPSGSSAWTRSVAQPGDRVFISGFLGLSHLGWKILNSRNLPLSSKRGNHLASENIFKAYDTENQLLSQESIIQEAIQKHLRPISAYLKLHESIRKYKINSAMDITDGLFQDSWKLAKSSNTVIQINLDKLPRLGELLECLSLDEIIGSGEELELLFISSEEIPEMVNHYPITEIGKIITKSEKPEIQFLYKDETYHPKSLGYEHF